MLTFYPFKSNRLGFYLGPPPSLSDVDYKKTMPFARSPLAIVIAGAVLLILGGIEISVLGQAIKAWQQAEKLSGFVSAVFLSCWLLAWSVGVLISLSVFVSMLFGRSLLLIYQGRLEVHMGTPGLGMVIREEAAQITTVELVDPDPKSLFPKEGKQLLINDAGSNTNSPIGSNMTASDLSDIRLAIGNNKNKDAKLDPIDHIDKETKTPASDTEKMLEPALGNESMVVLILANLVPLIGAFLFGWKLSEIMVLYWAETAIILLYQCLKNFVISPILGVLAGIFSLATAGGFMVLHLLFIWEIFVNQSFSSNSGSAIGSNMTEVFDYFLILWPALTALIVSHGYSFFTNFWPRRELFRAKKIETKNVMSRVVVMHLTVIFGAFLVFATGSNVAGVVLLIVLKIGVDITAHKKHHQLKLEKSKQKDKP